MTEQPDALTVRRALVGRLKRELDEAISECAAEQQYPDFARVLEEARLLVARVDEETSKVELELAVSRAMTALSVWRSLSDDEFHSGLH